MQNPLVHTGPMSLKMMFDYPQRMFRFICISSALEVAGRMSTMCFGSCSVSGKKSNKS